MATNDIGARVKLDGEQQYREQMRQITQQTKLLKAETEQMKSSWDKSTTAEQKAAQQTELLNRQIEQQKQAVETARANVERYSEETGESSSETLKWKNTLAQAETELNHLNQELSEVPNSMRLAGQRMEAVGQKMQTIGQNMTKVGKGLTTYVTTPIVGLAAAAVKTTSDFDSSMSKVQALSGATGEEFQSLRDKARQMGATTKYSAGEAADAMGYMALAGWNSEQMIEGLPGVLDLAAASGMELATASDLVTDYLSAFGLEAKDSARMADQLAYAQANSNTTTTQLGDAFGNSAAMMHSAGQTMETTTAILESFANQGIKGSEAGTALSAMMRDVIQRMKDGKIYIGDTAVQVTDANGNFRDMTDILADVETATEGMGTAEKDAALMTTFTSRSIKGVNMVLTEGVGTVKGYREELYNSTGAAQTMAKTMQDNLAGQLTILKSQLQELAISFGDTLVPSIRKAVEWVQKQVDKLNSLDESTRDQIVKFGLLAASIGPVVLIGGKLVSSIGKLVSGAGQVVEWIGKVIPGMSGLLSVLGPAAVAFGLAAAGGAALGFALKGLKEKYGWSSEISDFNDQVMATAEAAKQARDKVQKTTDALQKTSENAAQIMKEADTAATLTDRYAEELFDLAGKTNRTADEQRRMEAIIASLNKLYPGFTSAVLDSNGSIKMGTEDLRAYIDELKNTAKIEALKRIIDEYTEKIIEADMAVIEAEMALEDAQNASSKAMDKHTSVIEAQERENRALAEAQQKLNDLYDSGTATAEEIAQAEQEVAEARAEVENGLVEVNGETVKYDEALASLNDTSAYAADESKKLAEAQEDAEQAASDAKKEQEGLQKQLDKLTQEQSQLIDSTLETATATEESGQAAAEAGESYTEFGEDVEDAADKLAEAQQKIRDEYEKTRKSTFDSTMQQKDLWEELENAEGTSLEKMRAGLASHHQALSNWNSNASALIDSAEYKYNEGFRNMVNTVIQGGEDLAPELQVIYDAWARHDGSLEELLSDYGFTEADAAKQADIMAYIESVMENGLEATNEAVRRGVEESNKFLGENFRNPKQLINDISAGATKTALKAFGLYKETGTQAGKGYGEGASSSTGAVEEGSQAIEDTAEAGVKKVKGLEDDATAAGRAIGDGISTGARAARGGIDSAFTSLRAAVSTGITLIQSKKNDARTAGMQITTNISDGVNNSLNYVTTALNGMETVVNNGIKGIEAKKADAKAAGQSIGSELAAGVTSQNTAVYSAGNNIGQQLASGIGSTQGSATLAARGVANAARNEFSNADKADLYAWGNHMGHNFADGIAASEGAAVLAARRVANAVANILRHSTPKEGPLRDDDVWGLHMGQNFANGMRESIPDIENAVLQVAEAAAVMPTRTVVDIDAMTGRNMMPEALSSEDIMGAFMSAAERIDWRVVIGNREFGRILREQGAFA